MLKRSRWLLLKRPEKLTGEQRGRLAELVRRNLRTVRAYLLKEDFQSLWGYVSPYWAGQFLDRWCTRTMRSWLDPMKEVARMVALAPRPDSDLVPSPGAVLQWRCRRLQRKGQSDHQTGVWVPHLRGTGSRFVSRTWRPARTKTHPQILLTRRLSVHVMVLGSAPAIARATLRLPRSRGQVSRLAFGSRHGVYININSCGRCGSRAQRGIQRTCGRP